MEITQLLTSRIAGQINEINSANPQGEVISNKVINQIMEEAYERGLDLVLANPNNIDNAIKYVEFIRPVKYGSTQFNYVDLFLNALKKIKDKNLVMKNPVVEAFAHKSAGVIKKLIKDGLEVSTGDEIVERRITEKEDCIQGGMIYHPELTELVREARSKNGRLNWLEARLMDYLRPYLPKILDKTQMKYILSGEKQRISAEANIAFETGSYPIINGLILGKNQGKARAN